MLPYRRISVTQSHILRFYIQRKKRQCNLCSFQMVLYSTKNKHRIQISDIDPRIEALQEKLLYSDYIENKYLKVGYLENLALKKSMHLKLEKAKSEALIHTPVFSVLLDKAESDNKSSDVEEEHDSSIREQNKKPLHMPYARIDKYQVVEDNKPENMDVSENINSLNERYKNLYEKYLEVKRSSKSSQFNKSMTNFLSTADDFKNNLSNVPSDWMADYEEYDDTLLDNPWAANYGTPNPNAKVSSVPCGGCGALLHCNDVALPGYLPSELFLNKSDDELKVMICQRCHFLKYYNAALEVKVSADEYPELLKVIKKHKAAVILMVDLTDFPCSIWPDIHTVLSHRTPIFVVGNKVDLLPQDHPRFFEHIIQCLKKSLECTKIDQKLIKHVALISAKTGYGVEELINKLHLLWGKKGDLFLIGCTNVGKSSLFNALLNSDYCKVQAIDLVQRAVTSPWPGTTLNLLKFPIMNPHRIKLYERTKRLKSELLTKQAEHVARIEKFKETRRLEDITLQGHIGRTFSVNRMENASMDPFSEKSHKTDTGKFGLDETSELYQNSRWLYDTPGTMHKDQILDLLTIEELMLTLPKKIISPRTFMLKPLQTIFLAGLGRLDYVDGRTFIRCTIFASNELPITICHTEDADDLYRQLLLTKAFAVPMNDPKRLEKWPALESKEMEVTGISNKESAADVVLSSAGWIAITPKMEERVLLKAWTPQGRGLHLRTPALLKKSVTLRGPRIQQTPAYLKGKQVYIKK